MITLINDSAGNRAGQFNLICTDPPFEMSGGELHAILNNYDFEHLLLIASMHQILYYAKRTDLEFSFDMVVSHVKPKKSRNYHQPNYLHSNIVYFKKAEAKSAFDRRLVERHDHYSDKKTNYYPSIFHAPKQDIVYKYQKNQNMINDLIGAFDVRSVCDPFAGSGTVGLACLEHGKDCTLIERDKEAFNIMKQQFDCLGESHEIL